MAEKAKKTNKYVEDLKQGFQDIQTVTQEGNIKLFVKQFVAVLVIFLLYRYLGGKFAAKISNFNGQMEAVRVQQVNEQEYQSNKDLLITLEPQFPPIEEKNEWLLSKIIEIFKEASLTPDVSGMPIEDVSNSAYVVSSLQASSTMGFLKFAEFLANIENRDEYVKVSNFIIEKDTDPANVGSNKVSMKFNTIFPKEKVGKTLFKDFDRLVAEKQAATRATEK